MARFFRPRSVASIGALVLMAICAPNAAHAQQQDRYYYYFKERRPLVLDTSRLAVFRDMSKVGVAAGAPDLSRHGIEAQSVQAHSVAGLAWVSTPAARANPQGVSDLVREMAADDELEFVSPVFLDDRNLPAIITRDLIVGFADGVSRDQAIAALDMIAPGEILDTDFAGLKHVYRVRAASRDGFEVLDAANLLAERVDVAFAEPDIMWTGVKHLTPNDPRYPSQWGLNNVGQSGGTPNMDMDGPEAWDISLGSETIIVAILDDGVDQLHPDLNQIPGFDATGNGTNGAPLNSCDNHGTAVAGCVSAVINNATGGTGIAPNTRIVSTKFAVSTVPCDGTGSVSTSWVLNALISAESVGARVTNTSWSIGPSSTVTNKFASMRDAGVVHFASAGNSAIPISGYPASAAPVNSVSAIHRSGNLASFSSFGPDIAFTAPGQSIWTTDRVGPNGYTSTNEAEVSGTSFSSPYTAGVAAMVLSVDSSKSAAEVEQILRETALDLGASGWDDQFGYGLVKAAAAMAFAAPNNLTCADAVVATCNSNRTFLNVNVDNTPSPAFSCGDGSAHDGALWFQFVATDTSARISTCLSEGADSTIGVYAGTCGGLTEIACSEVGECGASELADLCVAGLTVGETYYIQLASRTPADRGLYSLEIGCSCTGACCALPPADPCTELRESECADVGGSFGGPDTVCQGDADGDGEDDGCEVLEASVFQLPAGDEELAASNVDAGDLVPNVTHADDFVSDRRPIKGVRWWGASLDVGAAPDGWFLAFYEPLSGGGSAAEALGLYYCDADVVSDAPSGVSSCVDADVLQYDVALRDCCLVSVSADSRTLATPTGAFSFAGEECLDYHFSVQAVVGVRYESDGGGGCSEQSTGNAATGDFWGWQTTTTESANVSALSGSATSPGTAWSFGPWSAASAACGTTNLSVEFSASEDPGAPEDVFWSNGIPNDQTALNSQFGGEMVDFLTVDDFEFTEPLTVNRVQFVTEDENEFQWSGRVRLEIYPDDGALAPDESGGPTIALWIPDDQGAVTRTHIGPGQFEDRYGYDIQNVNLSLGAGVWWIGLAPAGLDGTDGQVLWATSHTKPPDDPGFYGGEAHLRAPSAGIPSFAPWDDFLPGPSQHDVNFSLSFAAGVDCNCNGTDDAQDIVELVSDDCNANGIPDECEWDCNGNGVPDECDLTNATSLDCLGNGVPDECNVILGGYSDSNGNLIPDACECPTDAVTVSGEPDDKNRFLSLVPGNAGTQVALRVRLVDVLGYEGFNNEVRWVGPLQTCSECSSGSFEVATLQCTPHFADWGSIGILDIMGTAVVPGSTFEVQVLHENCAADLTNEANYSAPLSLTTAKFGDVVAPWGGGTQPNFSDVTAVVDCFKCSAAAPRKAYCLIQPNVPNACGIVSFADITKIVDAFKGLSSGLSGPSNCP